MISPMSNVALRGLSEALHSALRDAADRNHRSLNGEILARLEASFRAGPRDPAAILTRIRERAQRLAIPDLTPEVLEGLREEGRP